MVYFQFFLSDSATTVSTCVEAPELMVLGVCRREEVELKHYP
jgi:hypothetical protein